MAFLSTPGRSVTAPYPFGAQVWAELRCKSSQGWANFLHIRVIPKKFLPMPITRNDGLIYKSTFVSKNFAYVRYWISGNRGAIYKSAFVSKNFAYDIPNGNSARIAGKRAELYNILFNPGGIIYNIVIKIKKDAPS